MNFGKPLRVAAIASCCLAAGQAWSQDRGLYAGASLGRSQMSDVCEGVTISCDKTDTAWKLFAGYYFTPSLAAEVGYSDFGEAKASGVIAGANVDATYGSKAWELVGLGLYPIGQVSLYAKLGAYFAKTDVRSAAAVPGFSTSGGSSDKNNDLTFGAGLRFALTRNFVLQGDWQRYNDVGGDDTGKTDIDVLSVGVVYRFF